MGQQQGSSWVRSTQERWYSKETYRLAPEREANTPKGKKANAHKTGLLLTGLLLSLSLIFSPRSLFLVSSVSVVFGYSSTWFFWLSFLFLLLPIRSTYLLTLCLACSLVPCSTPSPRPGSFYIAKIELLCYWYKRTVFFGSDPIAHGVSTTPRHSAQSTRAPGTGAGGPTCL